MDTLAPVEPTIEEVSEIRAKLWTLFAQMDEIHAQMQRDQDEINRLTVESQRLGQETRAVLNTLKTDAPSIPRC